MKISDHNEELHLAIIHIRAYENERGQSSNEALEIKILKKSFFHVFRELQDASSICLSVI